MRFHRAALLVLFGMAACADQGAHPNGRSARPITNGAVATAGSHPYAVFLRMAKQNGETHVCSGALIAPDLVLTAAHCLVCTTGVSASILGEGVPGEEPGGEPLLFHFASSFEFLAEAFPELPNCALTGEAYSDDSADKMVPGADIGVVRLVSPSSVTPKSVLLQPPHGWSPHQDLAGQTATIVGRGDPDPGPDVDDFDHMRFGTGSLDRFSNTSAQGGECADPNLEPFSLVMLNDTGDEPGLVESTILHGDSGGPMLATIGGVEYVIGVASGGFSFVSRHAPVFTAQSAAFLRGHLGLGGAVSDADGDNVIDWVDNCPGQANRDQFDRDGDGVGDLCDNCTPLADNGLPILFEYDDAPTSDYLSYYNPSQANCNREAELDQIFTDHPDYGGALPPLTDAGYMAAFGGDPECADGLAGTRHRYLRGDACDPIPCAQVETVRVDITDKVAPASPSGICQMNGHGIGVCGYEMPSGFELESIARPADDGTEGGVGLRFCACAGERGTPALRRQNCGAATTFNCAIDGTAFSAAGSPWRPLSLIGPPIVETTFGPDRPAVTVEWDFLADLAALTGEPVPPPPWSLEDGHIAGGPRLEGILWSHVARYGGDDIGAIPGDNGGRRSYREVANSYSEADTRIHTVVTWHEFPEYKPAWPWEYCAQCVLALPWTWVLDAELPAIVGVGPEGAQDTSRLFDRAAVELLAGPGIRIGAAEPEYRLDGISRRELVLDGAARTVLGALHVTGGAVPVVGEAFARRRSAPAAVGNAWVAAYSAFRDQLWLLAAGERSASLVEWTREGGWQERLLSGDRLLEPLALTFRLEEGALYALDRQPAGGSIRLVRIDLLSGRVSVLEDRLIEVVPAAISLSVGTDENLLVAAALGGATHLARLDVTGRSVRLRSRARHPGAMTGDARETRAGVAMLVPRGRFFDPQLVSATSFERAEDGSTRPIF